MTTPATTAPALNRETALRIALAARTLPGVGVGRLLEILRRRINAALDEESLKSITVTDLKTGFGSADGEEDGEDISIGLPALKDAVRILWGEGEGQSLPALQPALGDTGSVIKVAVASNDSERLDGHFGSCLRFLIYQLSKDEVRLVDIRSTLEADLAEDRNAFRADLIRDCEVLFVQSIGGPAAAKVVRAGVYPIKVKEAIAARDELEKLRLVMDSAPPPWLAKRLGVSAEQRARFDRSSEVM